MRPHLFQKRSVTFQGKGSHRGGEKSKLEQAGLSDQLDLRVKQKEDQSLSDFSSDNGWLSLKTAKGDWKAFWTWCWAFQLCGVYMNQEMGWT